MMKRVSIVFLCISVAYQPYGNAKLNLRNIGIAATLISEVICGIQTGRHYFGIKADQKDIEILKELLIQGVDAETQEMLKQHIEALTEKIDACQAAIYLWGAGSISSLVVALCILFVGKGTNQKTVIIGDIEYPVGPDGQPYEIIRIDEKDKTE